MEKFTASNGLMLVPHRDGSVRWEAGFSPTVVTAALREFFLHERDQELGRWRWPENPDYVVYLVGDDTVDVLRERSISDVSRGPGRQEGISREQAATWDRDYSQNFFAAARAYFAAHPEPKPWHDAKPGEVWVLTGAGGLEQPWRRLDTGRWISCTTGMLEYNDEHAIAGRRIWPEVSDD